jgi:hypothetical protein
MQKILIFIPLFFLGGCMLAPATSEPIGDPNLWGVTPKKKQSEVAYLADQTTRALEGLPREAYAVPHCSPDLTAQAEQLCVLGTSMALAVAYATGAPTTAAGEIARSGQVAISTSVNGLTARSAGRMRALTLGLTGYFGYQAIKTAGDANARIAETVSQNGGIQIGSIQQSSSRHSSPGGGEGGAEGGGLTGDSTNVLQIGRGNNTGMAQDSGRIAGGTNGSMATQAETSANVNQQSDIGKVQGQTTADELNAPVNVSDDDGGQSLL